MDRRLFLTGVLSTLFPVGAFANIGLGASPQLIAAFESMYGIPDGYSGGTLHILYAPWCHISPRVYRDSRALVETGKLTIKWIPHSGGQPEGSNAVEFLLTNPSAENVPASFTHIKTGTEKGTTPLADQQDHEVANKLESLIIRDSGRGLVTPTLAYRMGDRVRLLPGGIGYEDLELIAMVAT